MHWLPYYVQCNPCHEDYRPDHVININTWQEDTTAFLNTAGINTNRFILLNLLGAQGTKSEDITLSLCHCHMYEEYIFWK